MLPLFRNGQLAIVQAVGSPDPTRSHFDAQDFMESGTPGRKATDDGWLNRALQTMPEEKPSPFRAVAFGPYLPRTLQGTASAIAIPDLKQFKMNGPQQTTEGGFEAMYAQTVDHALRGVGIETFEAIDQLKKINPDKYEPENGAQYPKNRFGQSLQEIAELFKADPAQPLRWVPRPVRRSSPAGTACAVGVAAVERAPSKRPRRREPISK